MNYVTIPHRMYDVDERVVSTLPMIIDYVARDVTYPDAPVDLGTFRTFYAAMEFLMTHSLADDDA